MDNRRDGGPPAWRSDLLDGLALLLAVALIALVSLDVAGPGRAVLAFGFAFFVPGRAIAAHWRQLDGWSAAAVPMVMSLAVLGLLATVTLWAHAWHPLGLFQVVAWLSLAGLTAGLIRRHRPARTAR
ncbi:MAG: hypothetical protein ACLQDY_14120 [Streptosporangiaceae bacterium]